MVEGIIGSDWGGMVAVSSGIPFSGPAAGSLNFWDEGSVSWVLKVVVSSTVVIYVVG